MQRCNRIFIKSYFPFPFCIRMPFVSCTRNTFGNFSWYVATGRPPMCECKRETCFEFRNEKLFRCVFYPKLLPIQWHQLKCGHRPVSRATSIHRNSWELQTHWLWVSRVSEKLYNWTHHLPIALVFHIYGNACLLYTFRFAHSLLFITLVTVFIEYSTGCRCCCCCCCCCVSHLVPLFICDSVRIIRPVDRYRVHFDIDRTSRGRLGSRFISSPFHRRSCESVCLFLVHSPISDFSISLGVCVCVCVWCVSSFIAAVPSDLFVSAIP